MMQVREYVDGGLDLLFAPRRLGTAELDILEHLTAGDMLVSFLCSSRSTKAMCRDAYKRAKARYAAKQAINRLEQHGLIRKVGPGFETATLTSLGQATVLKEIMILNESRKTMKKWDGMWRIVSFDVPQTHKMVRDVLRHVLHRAGFQQIQKSLYIHPYPCDALVRLIRLDKNLAKFTFFCTTGSVSANEIWKKKFRLK